MTRFGAEHRTHNLSNAEQIRFVLCHGRGLEIDNAPGLDLDDKESAVTTCAITTACYSNTNVNLQTILWPCDVIGIASG